MFFLAAQGAEGSVDLSTAGDIYSAMGRLAIFLFIVAGAYFTTKFIAKSKIIRRGGNLFVIEAVSVGVRGNVQLVKAGDQVFLIGVTPNSISLIAEIDSAGLESKDLEAVAAAKKIPIPFERYLKNITGSETRAKKNDYEAEETK